VKEQQAPFWWALLLLSPLVGGVPWMTVTEGLGLFVTFDAICNALF